MPLKQQKNGAPPKKINNFFGQKYLFNFFFMFTLKIVLVLLSVSVERVGVSRIRDFFYPLFMNKMPGFFGDPILTWCNHIVIFR